MNYYLLMVEQKKKRVLALFDTAVSCCITAPPAAAVGCETALFRSFAWQYMYVVTEQLSDEAGHVHDGVRGNTINTGAPYQSSTYSYTIHISVNMVAASLLLYLVLGCTIYIIKRKYRAIYFAKQNTNTPDTINIHFD